jgi:hypothetical protein
LVDRSIAFGTLRYHRNEGKRGIREKHWSSRFNSSCDENRCSLVKMGVRPAYG